MKVKYSKFNYVNLNWVKTFKQLNYNNSNQNNFTGISIAIVFIQKIMFNFHIKTD